MNSKYLSIINNSHHVSLTRKPMTIDKRAAQFAPFAALTGYDDLIKESNRTTTKKLELDEDKISKINFILNELSMIEINHPHILLTYYEKDLKKDGGTYLTREMYLHQIDIPNELLISTNKDKINFNDIFDIKILDD